MYPVGDLTTTVYVPAGNSCEYVPSGFSGTVYVFVGSVVSVIFTTVPAGIGEVSEKFGSVGSWTLLLLVSKYTEPVIAAGSIVKPSFP